MFGVQHEAAVGLEERKRRMRGGRVQLSLRTRIGSARSDRDERKEIPLEAPAATRVVPETGSLSPTDS